MVVVVVHFRLKQQVVFIRCQRFQCHIVVGAIVVVVVVATFSSTDKSFDTLQFSLDASDGL